MWKNNGACLRSCSSAILQHGFGRKSYGRARGVISVSCNVLRRFSHVQHGQGDIGGAIDDNEFLEALRQVLPLNQLKPAPHTVGIAVSGGVDSMALATLYAKCEGLQLPKLHGIIIDHKARPKSTEEAHWVAEQLSALGIQSSVIPLTWPEAFDVNRFESEARKLRYQALGRACRDNEIKSLMVAHHADDQAETIMMRLVQARLRSGLQGMKSVGWIPECFGIHGVYHSGTPVRNRDPTSSLVEHGGIQILRPLLAFEKSRLVATCEKHNTRWAEDKTNQDKTLTMRNALRHVIKEHLLPRALSRDSLIHVAQTVQSRIEKHQAAAEAIFNSCPLKLDIQIGALTVRLPPVDALFPNPTSAPSSSDKLQARNTAHSLLRRISELVSPMESPFQEHIANAVLNTYPSLAPEPMPQRDSMSMSYYGCWWVQTPLSAFDRSILPPSANPPTEWFISRQPPQAHEHYSITFPPQQTSDWQLFDGRFWVRVKNQAEQPISMRMLTAEELVKILQIDSHSNFKWGPEASLHQHHANMSNALSAVKPHAIRRTVPALFLMPTDVNLDQTLLALPTLQSSDLLSRAVREQVQCTWEVRYKKVDPGTRALSKIVTEPVKYRDWGDLQRPWGWETAKPDRGAGSRSRRYGEKIIGKEKQKRYKKIGPNKS